MLMSDFSFSSGLLRPAKETVLPADRDSFTPGEVAKLLKVSGTALRAAVKRHKLPAYARRSADEIDAAIEEERKAWD